MRTRALVPTLVVLGGAMTGCFLGDGGGAIEGRIGVPGGQVWYREVGPQGHGTPLLVLHGGPGIPHDYLQPLEVLSKDRPVIFYDQLGCGNSERAGDKATWTIEHFMDELAAVRGALKLERVHLFGHSWGTMLAVDYMLTRKPEGVASLTLCGSALSMERWTADQHAWFLELPAATQAAIQAADNSGNYESPAYQEAIAAFYAQHICRLDPWPDCVQRAVSPEKMNKELYEYMCGPSEFSITGTLKNYERAERLAEIHAPTLFVCGRFDEATPASTDYYHRKLPGSEIAVIENASHMCFVERPHEFNRRVGEFLRHCDEARR